MAANLDLLKPRVKALAIRLMDEWNRGGNDIVITQTLRTFAEQDALYAQGRTKPGAIVTNARGGYSFHNHGVAFDVCPVIGGKAIWNDLSLFRALGEIGMRLGLEWGGTWASFPDYPHFQYTAGYSIEDFLNKRVDENKFALAPAPAAVPIGATLPATFTVQAREGLNVRTGPGAEHAKIGKLAFGEKIKPLERSVWIKIAYQNQTGWVNGDYLA